MTYLPFQPSEVEQALQAHLHGTADGADRLLSPQMQRVLKGGVLRVRVLEVGGAAWGSGCVLWSGVGCCPGVGGGTRRGSLDHPLQGIVLLSCTLGQMLI